ncbi:MAG: GUN4 domain-containing protein [Cyanobacteria bacterium J06634_5]
MTSTAVTVFFSYSHKDEALRNELANHLNGLKLSGVITDWHDRKLLPGDEWDRQIKDNLNSAQIILLLVSSDFIGSRYCGDVEIKRAMERHEAGEARVIPVILRRCLWHRTPFGKLQALPKNGAPVVDVSAWPTQDDAFCDVAEGIYQAALSFSETTTSEAVGGQATQTSVARSVQKPNITKASEQETASNAQAQYRARVKEYLIERSLTTFHYLELEHLQAQLKLPKAEAQRIMTEELAPIEQARETYRNALARLIEDGHNPQDGSTQQWLSDFQQKLRLTQAEIAEIERPILAAAEQKFEVIGSERGIDYAPLRDLLKAGDWKAADKETYEVMIRAVGKNSGDYFTKEELLNFPCKDLLTIDRLWVKYSEGRFGFSVQKKIYVACGAKLDGEYPGDKIWKDFEDRVGWRVDGSDVSYTEVTFDTSAPEGHLPNGDLLLFGLFHLVCGCFLSLFSHRDL